MTEITSTRVRHPISILDIGRKQVGFTEFDKSLRNIRRVNHDDVRRRNRHSFSLASSSNPREELVTTRRLLVAIAAAANSGFNSPVTASGIAIPL